MAPDYDIIIVGGGMAGASLASALSDEDVRIAVIEAVSPCADDQPSYDDRSLTLSLSSIRILDGIGVWEHLLEHACPLQHVHVSDRHHFGCVRLDADMLRIPALGYIVVARELGRALLRKLEESGNIDLICPASVENLNIKPNEVSVTINTEQGSRILGSKLLVAADGTDSKLRELLQIRTKVKDYKQTVIVTNVTMERQHDNTAFERFTDSGPFALLPLKDNHCTAVYTVDAQAADYYMQLDDQAFIDCLQSRFGKRLGKFQRVGKRKSYPVRQLISCEQVRDRTVILGNAVHTVHPNAAQGFNLCLRDVAGLIDVLVPALQEGQDPGARHLLDEYVTLRAEDQDRVMCFTDSLARLFYNDLPHKVIARNTGMLLLDLIPSMKRSFMRRVMGLHGRQPSLVMGPEI